MRGLTLEQKCTVHGSDALKLPAHPFARILK